METDQLKEMARDHMDAYYHGGGPKFFRSQFDAIVSMLQTAYDLGRASAPMPEEVREVLMDVKLYMSSCMCACEHDYECLRCRLPRRIDALEGRKG